MQSEIPPKVSVCVVTYNQEKYIRQCLQSIVDQVTNFTFEVIVGEDGSKDSTRDIVREFEERYPGIVKPIYHEKNVGPTQNYLSVHNHATGTYVSHIDGDDLAHPGKLQAQVDLLDKDASISLCGHAVNLIDSGGNSLNRCYPPPEFHSKHFTFSDVINLVTFMVHSSFMYRKPAFKTNVSDSELLDYYFMLEYMGSGFAYCISDTLGSYRVCGMSVTATSSETMNELFSKTFLHYSRLNKKLRVNFFIASLLIILPKIKNMKRFSRYELKLFIENICFVNPFEVFKIRSLRKTLGRSHGR